MALEIFQHHVVGPLNVQMLSEERDASDASEPRPPDLP
jgi:hypothetical protein